MWGLNLVFNTNVSVVLQNGDPKAAVGVVASRVAFVAWSRPYFGDVWLAKLESTLFLGYEKLVLHTEYVSSLIQAHNSLN